MLRSPTSLETNDRLLAAAAEVFCEVGYRGATLREICRRGHANVAAVNYHFRDKEQLYTAVLHQAVVAAGEGLAQIAPDPTDAPEQQLRHFIRGLLANLLGADRPVQLLRLLAHEMVEPTPALALVVEKGARPVEEILRAIIAEMLGQAADAALIRDCAESVMAQCASYHHSKAILQKLHGLDVHDPATIEHVADHVFRFSLGGIQALAKGGSAGVRRSRIPGGTRTKRVGQS
jgi:TetR/AcrR family transcriptional regulator, regulator of cefoperazone and chloramphenicol sensitivity